MLVERFILILILKISEQKKTLPCRFYFFHVFFLLLSFLYSWLVKLDQLPVKLSPVLSLKSRICIGLTTQILHWNRGDLGPSQTWSETRNTLLSQSLSFHGNRHHLLQCLSHRLQERNSNVIHVLTGGCIDLQVLFNLPCLLDFVKTKWRPEILFIQTFRPHQIFTDSAGP